VPAVRKTFLLAIAGVTLLAGCGSSDTVDPAQAAAELALNRGPQDYAGPAVDAEQAARRLAQADVRKAGGPWEIEVTGCQKSGPVTSCDILVSKADVKCSATAAVRIRAERGTAHRTPFACGPGA
jgi:hypothetical protein